MVGLSVDGVEAVRVLDKVDLESTANGPASAGSTGSDCAGGTVDVSNQDFAARGHDARVLFGTNVFSNNSMEKCLSINAPG